MFTLTQFLLLTIATMVTRQMTAMAVKSHGDDGVTQTIDDSTSVDPVTEQSRQCLKDELDKSTAAMQSCMKVEAKDGSTACVFGTCYNHQEANELQCRQMYDIVNLEWDQQAWYCHYLPTFTMMSQTVDYTMCCVNYQHTDWCKTCESQD